MTQPEFKNLIRNPLGYWEVTSKPTPAELQAYYAGKYYQEAKGSYENQYSDAELQYFRTKIALRWSVVERFVSAPGSLLDVGCGEGYTLAFFRELGWQVKGLDYSQAGLASKNPQCLDALATGDVFELLQAELAAVRNYNVIWLQNVLEHVIDPVRLMHSLHELVAPGGVLVVTVPNDFSDLQMNALQRGHIDREFWVALPDHLSYFSHASLENIGAATGWNCAEVLGDFPIDWYLYHRGSNYVRDRSVGKAAHAAGVELENLIGTRPLADVAIFYAALAKIGMGRNLTAFYRPKAP
jgi:2-polyprenyl-3-methyl-5-hydroxy-6-metoxy-1,4-benzoquinol methylase